MSIARPLRPLLEPRGFGIATLQDPRVREELGLPEQELLAEMRVWRTTAGNSAAPKPSFISRGKFGGRGRSRHSRNSRNARRFAICVPMDRGRRHCAASAFTQARAIRDRRIAERRNYHATE